MLINNVSNMDPDELAAVTPANQMSGLKIFDNYNIH